MPSSDLKMRPTILVTEVLMECLKPGGRLNDTVIEGYLRLIERRNQEGVHGFLTVLALDTFYMKDLEDGLFIRAARRFKKVNPFDTELILIPLHIPTGIGHWVLIAVHPHVKRISTFDSLGGTHIPAMERVLHDLGRYAQSHDLGWSPQAWLLHDTSRTCPRQQNNVDCGVFLTWFAERLSRGQTIEPRQLNTLVWRVHMEEALRTSRLGAFDGHLAECQELLDPNFLNAEAWNLLECGVEDDTRRPSTEVPSRLELEYDAFMAELNEACDEYTEEVPANTTFGISVDDRNLSLLIFDDENWLDVLWEELQQELRASSADPPHLVPDSPVTTTNTPTETLSNIDPIAKSPTSYPDEIPNPAPNDPIECSSCPSPCLSLIADEVWLQDQLGENQSSSQVCGHSATSGIDPTPSSSNPTPTTSTSNLPPTTSCPNPSTSSNDASHGPEPRPRLKRKRERKKTIIFPGGARIKIPKRFLRM
ncbi:SUMO1 sentrin specific peptidase 1 [Homalodisca vitripennis]|nr:SUMO1 sentrin specific peptidase 1 [Homalodisca vitripennis]